MTGHATDVARHAVVTLHLGMTGFAADTREVHRRRARRHPFGADAAVQVAHRGVSGGVVVATSTGRRHRLLALRNAMLDLDVAVQARHRMLGDVRAVQGLDFVVLR